MIVYYSKEGIGDVLMIYLKEGESETFERKGDVARIFDKKSGEAIGFNFFHASEDLPSLNTGEVRQDEELIRTLNHKLARSGFSDRLTADRTPSIVTAYVEKCEKHPDSDHMHVCLVDVGDRELQIVCGAPNIKQGQKVVVARPGALMPGGLIIRPTVLRGVASDGMICSARELALPHAPQKRGILVLDDAAAVGEDFLAGVHK
ncbi:YtpR family tRNA-binding protein [Sporolactobacillus sp. THM19-2]|uniref:YtpR family tRNA-binding protein n=1 Tax=Sporolactobacillus sp. THM19-2 TaxID=2511171 RepID=UPI0010229CE0|nr:DUF4479 family protein [Sporolactobacillus sp. THM19-2]RYL94555.1 DUF4479 domain-containing protein [Sporolactobacillus sp. THM19-2]